MGKTPTSSTTEYPRPLGELRSHIADVCGASVDEALLQRAVTHRSYAYEAGGVPHNERLEFLGDAVLGLVVTDHLHGEHPDLQEGQLAKMRSAVVQMRALADVARTIGLGDYLLLGRGEESTGGRDKASLLADTMEAVFGAVYLTGGLPAASVFVHSLLDPLIAETATMGAGLDWKTSLQEAASAVGEAAPHYEVTDTGPEHAKVFTATAVVGDEALGSGSGRTKKEAEQKAASTAWSTLRDRAKAEASAVAATAGPESDGPEGSADDTV
ncbi:ribonuclease III [Actinomycetota bacterium]